jgi:hypothetical protein
MVVEGWVDDLVVEKAASWFRAGEYSRVVATGSPIEADYLMATDGLLEWQLAGEGITLEPGDTIRLSLKGTPVQGVYPAFAVVLNDRVLYEASASGEWSVHGVVVDSSVNLMTLGIFFGNDDYLDGEDRNLNVRSIEVAGKFFRARSPYSFQYDKEDQFKKKPSPTDFHSMAAICSYKLIQRGISPDLVQTLPSRETDRNRTLASALAVRQWLAHEDLTDGCCLNVVSESIHARRTYILYTRALKGTGCQVGMIPVSLEGERYKGFTISRRDITRELAGSLYYRVLFNTRRYLKGSKGEQGKIVPP